MNRGQYKIIRTDGTETIVDERPTIQAIRKALGADVLDFVSIHKNPNGKGTVMLIDDLGHEKGLPVNDKGTQVYLAICKPGTDYQIRGDVAIVNDEDLSW
jgi:hypothetical protein